MVISFVIISCILLLTFVYYHSRRKYNYWKDRNVPFLKPLTFFGNYKDYILMKVYPPLIAKSICEQFPDAPYVGVFYGTEPALIIKDLELIKLVAIKDFYYFNGRESTDYNHLEVITQNVFFTQGDRWKMLRHNLSPLLSNSKIKKMVYLVKKCATEFEPILDKAFEVSSNLDVRELTSRYTIDVIILCVFGVNSNAMGDTDTNPFRIISHKLFNLSLLAGMKNCARSMWPNIFYALGFKMFDEKVNDFFGNLLKEVFEKREYKPSLKHDFVDLLLSLYQKKYITSSPLDPSNNNENLIEMEVNDDFLVAQCVVLFAGGFETSATTLTFMLYELAKHEDAQKRAIAEVDAYLHGHKDGVDYDVLYELPYLDACINETLRLHPLLGVLTRETMKKYTLPDGLVLEKGLRIHIPVSYLHLNPDNFPNPEEFDPERFMGEKRHNFKDDAYLPFGVGARLCLGMRFGKLVVLTGLVTILKKYSVKFAENTPPKVHYDPKTISAQPIEKILLTFTRRN